MSNQWREKPVHFFKCNCSCHKKILGQTYEKLRIRSDLGTCEEKLALNLRKTFKQCSIRCFVSAVLDPHITRYTRRFSPQLCSANYPLQHPYIRRSAHPRFTPGLRTTRTTLMTALKRISCYRPIISLSLIKIMHIQTWFKCGNVSLESCVVDDIEGLVI